MSATIPTPYVQAITHQATERCAEDYRPVVAVPNTFGGFDVEDEWGRRVRVAQEDPEGDVELYVFDRQKMDLRTEARFGPAFPATVVATVIRDAFAI